MVGVTGSPWMRREFERSDWSILFTFSESWSMIASFFRTSSRKAELSWTRRLMVCSRTSILANWLLKESNFSWSLARESSIAILRIGVVGLAGEFSDGEGRDLLFFFDGIEKCMNVINNSCVWCTAVGVGECG